MNRLVLFISAMGLVVGASAQKSAKPVIDPTAKVGVTTRVLHPAAARNWRGARHELRVVVWYPAIDTAIETKQLVGPPGGELFTAGSAMPHAAFEPSLRSWPLVVLSHGSGGSAIQMAWLGTELARAGYIAAAVDHPGNNSNETMTPEGMTLWWERATDVSNTIDALLADEDLGAKIDKTRIAAAGYSLGGYTVMELAGAQTDISRLFDLCRANADTAVCHIPEMKGMGSIDEILKAVRSTSGESLARSEGSFRDPRVKAVFAMAPALGFTQTEESLRAVRVPVEIVVGDADRIAPAKDNADYLRVNTRGARETVLPGVSHYDFLDDCTAAGKKTFPLYCSGVADREALHAQVAAMAVRFFDRALKLR
jgi:predicted dienelactone hydrolase